VPPAAPTTNDTYQSDTCAMPSQVVPRLASVRCSTGPLTKHATFTLRTRTGGPGTLQAKPSGIRPSMYAPLLLHCQPTYPPSKKVHLPPRYGALVP
jgi:hypothetical protein